MAIQTFLGFEAGQYAFVSTGTNSVQSSVVRTGAYALRVNPVTTAVGYVGLYKNGTSGSFTNFATNTTFLRFYLRIATLPASGSEEIAVIAWGSPGTTSRKLTARINSNGTLALYDSANALAGTGTTVLVTGRWYCVMMQSTSSASASTARLWLDQPSALSDAYEINTTATQTNTACETCYIGKLVNRSSQTIDVYYDDILATDTASECVAGEVRRSTFTAQESNAWTAGTGASNYTQISEVPSDGNTTYIQNPATSTPNDSVMIAQTASEAGIPTARCRGINVYAQAARAAAGTQTYSIGIDPGSGTLTYNTARGPTTQPTYEFAQNSVYSPTGNYFTSNNIRIGLRANNAGVSGQAIRVSQLIVEYLVDYPVTPSDTALLNTVYAAQITLKSRTDGVTTKTLNIASRAVHGGNDTYKPLLQAFSGIGMTVGQNGLPVKTSGSVTIADAYESFGEELRLSDHFQNWTPIEQSITVGYCLYGIGSTSFTFTQFFKGKITSWSKSVDDTDSPISLSVESLSVKQKPIGSIPKSESVANATYPGGTYSGTGQIDKANLKNALPKIFGGSVQIPAQIIGQVVDGTNNNKIIRPIYAVSSNSASPTTPYIYAKDDQGYHRKLALDGYGSGGAGGIVLGSNNNITGYSTAKGMTEVAYPLQTNYPLSLHPNIIITDGQWRFRGQNNAGITPTGDLYFRLFEVEYTDAGARPTKMLAEATVPKSSYLTQVRAAGDFFVDFKFHKAVVLKNDGAEPKNGGYAISMSMSTYASATTDFVDGGFKTSATNWQWNRTNNGEWSAGISTTDCAYVRIFGCDVFLTSTFSPFVGETNNGNWVSIVTQRRNTTVYTAEKLDLVAIIDPGTSAAAPNSVIETLTSDDSANWDTTAFAGDYTSAFGTYYRAVSGYIEGSMTVEEAIGEVCRQTACKVIQLNNGKLALWAYGIRRLPTKTFTDENMRVEAIDSLDAASVINKLKVSYGRAFLNSRVNEALSAGEAGYYTETVDNTFYESRFYSVSQALYGERELAEFNCFLLNDANSARTLGEYYFRHFDHPHKTVRMRAPLLENFSLELMNVVEVLSTALPAEFGTTSRARKATHNGTEVDLVQGEYWKRAQRYSGYIVGKDYSWSKGTEATIGLTVWLTSPCHPNAIT